MAYKHQEFPRWVYSATEQPRVVASQDELEALEGEWFTRPDLAPESALKRADEDEDTDDAPELELPTRKEQKKRK
jgi:hypothetical protein